MTPSASIQTSALIALLIFSLGGCGGGGSGATASDSNASISTSTGSGGSCGASGVLCVGSTRTYKTIQAAFNAVQPGQIILVDDGNYAGLHINKSGTSSAPIVIRAQGSNAIINSPNSSTGDGIFFDNASYVTIEGLTIQGRDSAGVQHIAERCIAGHNATPTSPMVGNVIRGVRCTDSGLECFYLSEFNSAVVENNTILTCGRAGGIRNHGIYLANAGADNTIIRGNTISGGAAAGAESNGIHMNGDLSVGGDGIISGLTIEGNTIYGNVQNGLNMDGVQNSTVRNNLIYNNGHDAMRAYKIDGAAGPINLNVVNNTLLAPPGWAIKISEDGGGHTVFNNILQGANGSLCVANANIHSDRNATDSKFSADNDNTTISLTIWQAQTGQDMHSLVSTSSALFVSGGYQLATNSPARASGVSIFNSISAPLTDIAGTARPQGGAFDMGAYQAN